MIGGARNQVHDAELLLKGVFAEESALDRAESWARLTLAEARVDPSRSPMKAARALRSAERRLTLVAARHLVERVNGHRPPSDGSRRVPPQLR